MEIGGYFGLELNKGEEFHKEAIALNTGRNAFEYILRSNDYLKVYIPFFICSSIIEPLLKLKIQYEMYKIDSNFYPIIDIKKLKHNEVILYPNYFGICNDQVLKITKSSTNVIIDNSQAFFSKPLFNISTFYSPRKFFGVSDGAYLYIKNKELLFNLDYDVSYKRFNHLLGRIDTSAEKFYKDYKINNFELSGQDIKIMSKLTKRILENIDYDNIINTRVLNFNYLNNKLKDSNLLNFEISDNIPMVYPYLINNGNKLKEILIKHKIYIPTYWNNILDYTIDSDWEYYLSSNLICLPIDQRYNLEDLKLIINLINKWK